MIFMSRLSKNHFWEWFKRNNKEYLEIKKKTKKEADYWLNELTAHLRVYLRYFGFSITLPENGPAILTITVNGKAMYFERAEAFVAKAPEIPGWTVKALEDPMPIDSLLEKEVKAAGIDPTEFSFSFTSDDLEIIIFHPLCTRENLRSFMDLAYKAVYNLLGERSFGLDLGILEIANLSEADLDDCYPLEELPIHLGSRRSSIVVDNNGSLLMG
jgi:hypothetical protein